eukprot:2763699-Amphidinium_carterae.2
MPHMCYLHEASAMNLVPDTRAIAFVEAYKNMDYIKSQHCRIFRIQCEFEDLVLLEQDPGNISMVP